MSRDMLYTLVLYIEKKIGIMMMMIMMIGDDDDGEKLKFVIERVILLGFFSLHFINLNFVVLVVLFPFGSRLDDVWKVMYLFTILPL